MPSVVRVVDQLAPDETATVTPVIQDDSTIEVLPFSCNNNDVVLGRGPLDRFPARAQDIVTAALDRRPRSRIPGPFSARPPQTKTPRAQWQDLRSGPRTYAGIC